MEIIPGGATIWARKTIDSVIFYDKPDKWFKIWFFLVNRVNHKDKKRWKRGECHVTYDEIREHTKATKNQIDHCIRFLKKEQMLATQKATRGMQLEVLKYSLYQDLGNYRSDTESVSEAKQKRNRSDTINNNVNNDKNISEQSSVNLIPLKEDAMTWKRYNENDHADELPAIDAELNESIEPLEEKLKAEERELNAKIRLNLKLVEPVRGIPFGTGKDMNFHVKIYRELLSNGWTHKTVIASFLELVETPHWKEKKIHGEYVGMNTVQFNLRNKKPV